MPLDMGQLLSLSLPITTCCCCEYKLADRSQVLAGILNFSLLWSVVAVTWEYWPGLPLPGAGFNYDHCQSPPPRPCSCLLLWEAVAVIFPQQSTESLPRPTSVPLHCLPRNDGEILLAIKVLCLLTASLHLCCACLQAADVSILRNSGHLALQSQHLPGAQHSHSVGSGRRRRTYGYHTRQMLNRRYAGQVK